MKTPQHIEGAVMDEPIELIAAAVGRIEATVIQMLPRLDGMESRLDGVETRLGGIETRLDRIERKLDRHEVPSAARQRRRRA